MNGELTPCFRLEPQHMPVFKHNMNAVLNKVFPSISADCGTPLKANFVLVCFHLMLMLKQCVLFFLLWLLDFLLCFVLILKPVMAISEHHLGSSLKILGLDISGLQYVARTAGRPLNVNWRFYCPVLFTCSMQGMCSHSSLAEGQHV